MKYDGNDKDAVNAGLLSVEVSYDVIHPIMPRHMQDRMSQLCQRIGVSIYDRESVYNQLQEMSHKLAHWNTNELY